MSTPLPAAGPLPDGPFNLSALGRRLTFARSLPDLAAALDPAAGGRTAVVQAPPGTGKTTLVPPLVANLTGSGQGRIIVTQPRRVAARAAARRLASLAGSSVGEAVGYTVRGERHTGSRTIVEFVTPGILLRRLMDDPALEGTAGVILDEVHERGLETDLLLGLLSEVRQLREDLVLIAMSATLDAARFAALVGGPNGPAPLVDCPSALYPLEVRWEPTASRRLDERGVTRAFLTELALTAAAGHAKALAADPQTDALVFVPGAREVSAVAGHLRQAAEPGTEVLELHGQVPAAEQDRAVSGRPAGGRPRIIVTTSLAESSLTVPGVRLVVDSGLSREPRRDAARGMSGLVTVSCSRASAQQRAGRAARQGPGTVIRAYPEAAYAAAPAQQTPEIATADLTSAALVLACWGTPGGRGLSLPDPPPAAALADAEAELRAIGAVDGEGRATESGRALVRVPVDPPLARALVDGAPVTGARTAAEVAAMVAGDVRAPGADLVRLLARLRSGGDPGARAWSQEVHRLERLAAQQAAPGNALMDHSLEPGEAAGFIIALAFPARVARRVAGSAGEQYLLASGTRAGLPADSPLRGSEWLAVADVTRAQGRAAAGTGAVIRAAAPLEAGTAEAAAAHLLTESVSAEFSGGRVNARRERRLGAIELVSTSVRATPAQGRAAVAAALAVQGLSLIGWSPAADALRRRLALLHRELGAPWPDVSEPALLERLDEWLAPELDELAGGARAAGINLADPLRRLLPWPEAAHLEELAPERLQVPSGSRVHITYPEPGDDGARPVVAVKLQECFGWAGSPTLAGGRVRVLFHLLSPAGRPLAVTDDLASFWAGPYHQVRAEMRGRYPKHPWPEDPWAATATARTKARS
ncbi:ATP-dependent helicase HrpB [Arthrobacter sp. Sa2CUA1]|uniref:ATP-dependent helicase HrpB n=1 Tax=Arthrobacter gallicola TaxID=2762225 RepID=A0ABR8UN66_9MICC|nr:ATP-dependent helicase HrpB [Arthrobacter gallicola]MBD7993999.1 ATP-dependent helicase HrpB [Arthrobacter gallicola]